MKHTYKIIDLGRLARGEPAPRGANFWVDIELRVTEPARRYFAHLNVEGGSPNNIVKILPHKSELFVLDDESNPTGPCQRISVEGGRTRITRSGSGYSGLEIELDEALSLHRVCGTDDSAPGALRGWTRVEHKSRNER